MKKIIFISILLFVVSTSCDNKKKTTSQQEDNEIETAQNIKESEGYKLMDQKCFICHFPVPNPEKRDEIIAPPMLRVQEHYKPAYPNKEDFVVAIKSWVKKPTEEKIQMPGAARKFKIMPYLAYTDKDIALIAETLYDVDFRDSPSKHGQGGQNQKLQLNNGERWQLNKEAITNVNGIIHKLENFKSDDIKAYNQLGKDVFSTAKTLILDKEVTNQKFEQLQAFFHNVEPDIHELMQVTTLEEGTALQEKLKKKFSKFFDFFE